MSSSSMTSSSAGGGGEPMWDEDLTHLLNSPVHGSLPWLSGSSAIGGMSGITNGLTRKDIGRLSSFDLAEMNQAATLSNQDISYERKKSRAKITRVEVNNGFDDLLQVLRLPNSRKNSRAKVIQYACERIRALEQENERLKQQIPTMPAANPGAMVWIPCSLTPTPLLMPQMRLPQKPSKKAKRNMPSTSVAVPAARASATVSNSMLHVLVYTCPHLLRHFDASTLAQLMQVSTEWRKFVCDPKQSYLWEALIDARWHIPRMDIARVAAGPMRQKWSTLHRLMHLPHGAYTDAATDDIGASSTVVAKGRSQGIDVWGVLARRSNSRTTRSVWRDGSVSVMQVVELRLVVQNMSASPVVVALSSVAVWPFHVLDASYGTLFEPRWIALNGAKSVSADKQVILKHMDFGVVSVYVSCPQVEFEEHFLARARAIQVACTTPNPQESHVIVVEAPFLPPSPAPPSAPSHHGAKSLEYECSSSRR
ncbi:Aste57867_19023 [Aphanomyces stellatus]|uniref:Aste57867_19023 protein n=1 Tax=Aphanomyces stellatus TaxID=120398 RepID=A0A485LBT5_9STRA|nr:hypothetical protein As57867_018959 [Aphanomyces stellatus]VFT95748.1 Aste57867_19023 [Aphanomyces stellatus]